MKLYKDPNAKKPINIKDIVYMTSQLDKFVKLYDKCIWEQDAEQQETIKKLGTIVDMLKRRDYETLFEDYVGMISYDVTNVKFEPEEIKAWHEFFGRNGMPH